MSNRAVVFTIFWALLAVGLVLFLWVTGMSFSNLIDRGSTMWNTATMSIRKSDTTSKAMVICLILIGTGLIVVIKSVRRV